MVELQETNKQDDLYFAGSFWVIGESVAEIFKGNFHLLAEKHLVDCKGNTVDNISRNSLTHKRLWRDTEYTVNGKDYTYYPRGRVSVFDSTVYIFIPALMNIPSVINAILKEYEINKLDYEIEINDTSEDQVDQYKFELK